MKSRLQGHRVQDIQEKPITVIYFQSFLVVADMLDPLHKRMILNFILYIAVAIDVHKYISFPHNCTFVGVHVSCYFYDMFQLITLAIHTETADTKEHLMFLCVNSLSECGYYYQQKLVEVITYMYANRCAVS